MPRTTVELVQGILGGDWDGTTDLTPYINSATVVITRVAACAVSRGVAVTTEELEIIERWLSAHFYGQSDKPYIEKRTERAMGKFAGETGMGFDSTLYGQTAMRIDPSGCLAALNKRQRAQVNWLGKVPSAQIPIDQRD